MFMIKFSPPSPTAVIFIFVINIHHNFALFKKNSLQCFCKVLPAPAQWSTLARLSSSSSSFFLVWQQFSFSAVQMILFCSFFSVCHFFLFSVSVVCRTKGNYHFIVVVSHRLFAHDKLIQAKFVSQTFITMSSSESF